MEKQMQNEMEARGLEPPKNMAQKQTQKPQPTPLSEGGDRCVAVEIMVPFFGAGLYKGLKKEPHF